MRKLPGNYLDWLLKATLLCQPDFPGRWKRPQRPNSPTCHSAGETAKARETTWLSAGYRRLAQPPALSFLNLHQQMFLEAKWELTPKQNHGWWKGCLPPLDLVSGCHMLIWGTAT